MKSGPQKGIEQTRIRPRHSRTFDHSQPPIDHVDCYVVDSPVSAGRRGIRLYRIRLYRRAGVSLEEHV
jgi:hypothetical protein